MRRQRLTITATLLALAGLGMTPTFASAAGPLLSGYGGPGQGNQAILGSAVVNGGSGGGSKGSGSGSRGSSSSGSSSLSATGANSSAGTGTGTATSSAGTAASTAAKGAASAAASQSSGKHAKQTLAGTSKTGVATSGSPSSLTASRGGVGGSETLGLSGADLLYILLAFGALVFTGFMTRSLARDPGGSGQQATKAMRRSTRVSS